MEGWEETTSSFIDVPKSNPEEVVSKTVRIDISKCPKCGSDLVDDDWGGEYIEYDSCLASKKQRCRRCGETWVNYYRTEYLGSKRTGHKYSL